MKTLLLDLGTHTGWAVMEDELRLRSGTLHLATEAELETQRREGRERSLDIRFSRFYEFINSVVQEGVTRIVFEDVGFLGTQMQTQLWASFRSAIWTASHTRPDLTVFCLSCTTLKKFATRTGHAKKPDMARALVAREPGLYSMAPDESVVKTMELSLMITRSTPYGSRIIPVRPIRAKRISSGSTNASCWRLQNTGSRKPRESNAPKPRRLRLAPKPDASGRLSSPRLNPQADPEHNHRAAA